MSQGNFDYDLFAQYLLRPNDNANEVRGRKMMALKYYNAVMAFPTETVRRAKFGKWTEVMEEWNAVILSSNM